MSYENLRIYREIIDCYGRESVFVDEGSTLKIFEAVPSTFSAMVTKNFRDLANNTRLLNFTRLQPDNALAIQVKYDKETEMFGEYKFTAYVNDGRTPRDLYYRVYFRVGKSYFLSSFKNNFPQKSTLKHVYAIRILSFFHKNFPLGYIHDGFEIRFRILY